MLQNLYIENIAVIQQADIDFSAGLTVLSGETGAGKSIIIDSIGAILGGRVSRDLIRTGQQRACVAAAFSGLSEQTRQLAARLGFEPEGDSLLLRREIFADGRNQCRIGGRPASLADLKALGEGLVSIYGQHDGQHLMNEQLHIEYLDAFGELEAPLEQYAQKYHALLQLNRRMKALNMSAAEKERRRIALPVWIDELEKAAVLPGEQEELLAERRRLQSEEKLAEGLIQAAALLDGSDDRMGAAALLSRADSALLRASRTNLEAESFQKRMQEVSVLTSELSGDLADALSRLEYSPERLEQTEQRLNRISDLCIKYSVPADGLEEHLAAMREELSTLDNLDDSLERMTEEYALRREELFEEAGKLHGLREKAAERLSAAVERELSELDLKHARFVPEVLDLRRDAQARFTKKGTDSVRFLLSANAGEQLKPLAKVASGGELSRIMLALKTVLSAGEQGVTAIFDEVDAGVSGRAAQRVAEKLRELSVSRQVLCITHLPQIASAANQHLLIEKTQHDGRTFTSVTPLDRAGRRREIARIIGGELITERTLASAEELISAAEKTCPNI